MTDADPTRFPDVLIVAQEQWDEVERRNQLLIRSLAHRHPGARFLFAESPLRSRHIRAWRPPRTSQVAANIWTIRPIRPLPGAACHDLSDRLEGLQLRRATRTLGLESPMIWTQDPRTATLLQYLPGRRLLYDLTDDWAAFETEPARRAEVEARIESLAARAELVLACSRPLERAAQAWAKRVHYVPNGVDAPGERVEPSAELKRLPPPRLGYVGTLHSSRLDVELLAAAAERRTEWSFVLLGPDLLDAGDRERLFALPNVHYHGVRPHAEVRGYLEALDVCLVPHLITDFTRSLDPLKMYEYLAAGRPVVASPVGIAPDLEAHIATAATADQLIEQAERAMRDDTPELASARRAAVAGATWESRARDIDSALGVTDTPSRDARVDVVIVSYNTRSLLEHCLTALSAQTDVELRVVVVDNASTDGSVETVRRSVPDAGLLELPENVGFARANNLGFARCQGEFVLLLNSDAFLDGGAVAELVAVARRHPRAGAVGPQLRNTDGTLQRSAWPFPHAGRLLLEAFALHRPLRRLGILEDLGTWDHDDERPVDFLIGACLLLRAEALAEVGGFDEGFWMYGEEADLQRRLARRGWEVVLAPSATVTHVGGASSQSSLIRLRQFYAGQRRFLIKHGTVFSWPTARVALVCGSLLRKRWAAARLGLGAGDSDHVTPR